MKNFKKVTTAALIIGISMVTGQAIAGNGNGKSYSGNNQTGLNAVNNAAGTAYLSCEQGDTISGVVKSFVIGSGNGMEIDTGDTETVQVYGTGPLQYWDAVGLIKPAVGDNVEVTLGTITYSDDSQKNVAVNITFTDTADGIDLRDNDTCVPLWRGMGVGR